MLFAHTVVPLNHIPWSSCYSRDQLQVFKSYLENLMYIYFVELAPRFPTSVLVTSITSSSATIQWMLTDPYNSSRPEAFTVLYGNSSGQLNFNTPEITASPTSQTYSTQLKSLQPGTVYFYRIDGSNQFTSISTNVRVFSTFDSGQCTSLQVNIPM